MPNPRFPNICPLGKIVVVTPGTPVSMAINCGPLGGGVGGTQQNPPTQGTALRQVILQADASNTAAKNLYILPRGYTAAANPGLIIAVLVPGQTIVLPPSGSQFGMLPENFVVDADPATTTAIIYGCGFFF
jgi:hypothetical protein